MQVKLETIQVNRHGSVPYFVAGAFVVREWNTIDKPPVLAIGKAPGREGYTFLAKGVWRHSRREYTFDYIDEFSVEQMEALRQLMIVNWQLPKGYRENLERMGNETR